MKEIIALHERILAQVGNLLPQQAIYFARDEESGEWESLPADLHAEVLALRQTLDRLVAEDFDYHVIVGSQAGPEFCLYFDEAPAGSGVDGTFSPEPSLFDQLRVLDWEGQRDLADRNADAFDKIMRGIERITIPLPPAKQFQRVYREETRDFIKEKRRDATKVHVMYWQEGDGLLEEDFPDGEALREALPDLVGEGAEIVTIVAHGKPLPVDKIDALKAAAIQIYGDRPVPGQRETNEGVIDVEAEVVEAESVPPEDRPAAG